MLWKSLAPVDSGGIWRYYNFTAGESWWSSDTLPPNDIRLSLSTPIDGTASAIEKLVVSLANDASPHYEQLSAAVSRLSTAFNLQQCAYSNDTEAA